MAQRRRRDAPDVLERDVEAAVQQRQDLGGQDDRLGGARAGAVAHVAAGHVRGALAVRVGRHDEPHGVVRDVAGDRHLPPERLHRLEGAPIGDAVDRLAGGAGGAPDDLVHLLAGGEADVQLEEEAVQLGLGQRVGALHLDRVLGRQHEERPRQLVDGGRDGDGLLLHRFEQGGLGLGRGAVDLVGQDQVGEDRPGLEGEVAAAGGVLEQDVGAGDVGRHQVRGELDPAVLEVERVGQGPDQHRLAEARHALQQDVAAGQQGDHDAAYDGLLADDHPADFLLDQAGRLPQIGDLAWRLAHRRPSSFNCQPVSPCEASPPCPSLHAWRGGATGCRAPLSIAWRGVGVRVAYGFRASPGPRKYSRTMSRRPLGTKLISGGADEVTWPGLPVPAAVIGPVSSLGLSSSSAFCVAGARCRADRRASGRPRPAGPGCPGAGPGRRPAARRAGRPGTARCRCPGLLRLVGLALLALLSLALLPLLAAPLLARLLLPLLAPGAAVASGWPWARRSWLTWSQARPSSDCGITFRPRVVTWSARSAIAWAACS